MSKRCFALPDVRVAFDTNFQFMLFGAPTGGSPVEDPMALSAVGVINGLFR